jgi:AraC-like DNA-binding protein
MEKQKAIAETIEPNYGSSFRVRRFDVNNKNGKPFWHFHPELQLVYVEGGSGKRHIGNHLSYFRRGDLVLIGPNLPHFGLTDQLRGNQFEIIVQFREDFLGRHFFDAPEMTAIKKLFERSRYGILFSRQLRKELGPRIRGLYERNSLDRMLELLEILQVLAETTEYELLNARDLALEVNQQENERIRKVYGYVRNNFREQIPLKAIAEEVNMTVPAFCRYFKKQSGKTFTQFVNEFRVIHACKLLTDGEDTISRIAMESGFNNFSHFNRLFRSIVDKTPNEYRLVFKELGL